MSNGCCCDAEFHHLDGNDVDKFEKLERSLLLSMLPKLTYLDGYLSSCAYRTPVTRSSRKT